MESNSAMGRTDSEAPAHSPDVGLSFYAVVFTDIVLSTGLRTRLGDGRADLLHMEVDALTRQVIGDHRGAVVKGTGDGVLAIFRGPSDALHAGIAIQERIARRNRGADVPVHLRVGIAAGEVNVTDDDVYGIHVNEAARLCSAAQPGSVLVAETVAGMSHRALVDFAPAIEVEITPGAPRMTALPIGVDMGGAPLAPIPRSLDLADDGVQFVGRTSELGTLLDVWERVKARGVELVVLTGDPGIGKTTLLGQFVRTATEDSGLVLYGRCDERPSAPYQPFVEALEHLVAHCSDRELDAVFRTSASELSRLLPSLSDRMGVEVPSRAADLESERWRLQDAIGTTLRALCDIEPVILVVDDLHWAGTTTLDLLARILSDDGHHRMMVLLSLRGWEPDADPNVHRLLGGRHRVHRSVTDVALAGLDALEVGELVAEWKHVDVFDERKSTELWEITAGNPLFVSQVLRSNTGDEVVPADIPPGVADVIGHQLDRLGGHTLSFLRTAALVGPRFELQVVAAATALERGAALDCLEEAVLGGFVRALDGSPVRGEFIHALVRRTIEAQLSDGRRRDLHARIAGALEESQVSALADRTRRLAFHWSEAGEFGDVVKGCAAGAQAAADAIDHFAIAEAIVLLDQAATLSALAPDARRDGELAVLRAEAMCLGSMPGAREAQLEAADRAGALGDGALLSRAALAHSRGYFTAYGQVDRERVAILEAALALCTSEHRARRALLMARLANELNFDDPDGRRFQLLDEALSEARGLGDTVVLASVLNHRLYVLGGPDRLAERLEEAEEMHSIARDLDDRMLEARSLRRLCAAAMEAADIDRLDWARIRLDELAGEIDLPGLQWELATVRASRCLLAGDLEEAGRQTRHAFNVGVAAGESDAYVFAGAQIMLLNYLTGRLPSIVEKMIEATPDIVTSQLSAWVARQLHLAGKTDQAALWWDRTLSGGLGRQTEVGFQAGVILASWAYMAAMFPGEPSVVHEVEQRLEPFGDRLFNELAPDQPGHHFLGMLADASGDGERSDRHFEAATSLLHRIGAPVMEAISCSTWSAALVRRGDTGRARALAIRARDLAGPQGASQIEGDALRVLEELR